MSGVAIHNRPNGKRFNNRSNVHIGWVQLRSVGAVSVRFKWISCIILITLAFGIND